MWRSTDATGDLLISKSAVSAEPPTGLWQDYQAFIARDMSEVEVEYLFVDPVFETLRRHGRQSRKRRIANRAGIIKPISSHTLRPAFITATRDADRCVMFRKRPRMLIREPRCGTPERDRASLDRRATYIVAASAPAPPAEAPPAPRLGAAPEHDQSFRDTLLHARLRRTQINLRRPQRSLRRCASAGPTPSP